MGKNDNLGLVLDMKWRLGTLRGISLKFLA